MSPDATLSVAENEKLKSFNHELHKIFVPALDGIVHMQAQLDELFKNFIQAEPDIVKDSLTRDKLGLTPPPSKPLPGKKKVTLTPNVIAFDSRSSALK